MTWLILDAPHMVYRAYAGTGRLAEGVVYGFLVDLANLQDTFAATSVAFCFDAPDPCLREAAYPAYKAARKARRAADRPDRKAEHAQIRYQTGLLRDKALRALGYANVLVAAGYEADDLIASVAAHSIPAGDDAVIVSSDHDLWQLVRPGVVWHNPASKRTVTAESFTAEWGIEPRQWVDVKALSGCGTDSIEGVDRVGELTAARYLRGTLNKGYQVYAKLEAATAHDTWRTNLPLVRLPFVGCPRFTLGEDSLSAEKYAAVAARLGLGDAPPPVFAMRGRCVV